MGEAIITIVFGVLIIIGLLNEDKLVAFEDRIIEKIKNHKN